MPGNPEKRPEVFFYRAAGFLILRYLYNHTHVVAQEGKINILLSRNSLLFFKKEIPGVLFPLSPLLGNPNAGLKIVPVVNPMGNEWFNKRSINISYPFGTRRDMVKKWMKLKPDY